MTSFNEYIHNQNISTIKKKPKKTQTDNNSKGGKKNIKMYERWPACEAASDLKESKVSSINISLIFPLK